jgi:N-acetylated-alpha-linked acidic dipeptidase
VSVERRLRAQRIQELSGTARDEARSRRDLHIAALGSGSDYTAFLQHLGIPSMNLGYGGEDDGGIYHSIYDDFYWYTHFSDTSFVYGRALAQTTGTAVMRLADADVLPYDYTDLAETVHRYVNELQALASGEAAAATELERETHDSAFAITNDPRNPLVAPTVGGVAPHLEFAALENAADSLTRAAQRYDAALARAMQGSGSSFAAANAQLLGSERALTSEAGLPNRSWFRHLLYAPGYYTGYGVKTIPGVREAIEQKDWALANHEIVRVARALDAEAALVDRAAGDLAH